MEAAAQTLIAELRSRGVELRADGNRLRFRPASAVTGELRDRLRRHKADILAALRQGNLYEVPIGWTPQTWAERLRYPAGV